MICRQKKWLSVSDKSNANLFAYGENDLCEVTVQDVRWPARTPLATRELQRPPAKYLKNLRTYRIHAGYRRVLLGFLREIDFMYEDKISYHSCLHRATYLLKILDLFAQDLTRIPPGNESSWRSRSLNPLLQRQLHGLSDHEAKMTQLGVGKSRDEAVKFYLGVDPLHPRNIHQLMREILYVSPVRLGLGFLSRRADDQEYANTEDNTDTLFEDRRQISDKEYGESKLLPYELRLIKREKLDSCYKELIEAAVSPFRPLHPCLILKLSPATLRVCWR